ncbi:MAG TPA: VOC family protein [Nitrospiraceae bacterium]|nr:VOC family protein [Nitrospiraceae bacterium]
MNDAARGLKGLWHLALKVTDLSRSQTFYETLFSMRVVWRPDPENVYLSSGQDNLALHQIPASDLSQYKQNVRQYLDHLGFIVDAPDTVDRLFREAEQAQATIVKRPTRHRDGSYSFYMADPDGNTVQVLYEPNISGTAPE